MHLWSRWCRFIWVSRREIFWSFWQVSANFIFHDFFVIFTFYLILQIISNLFEVRIFIFRIWKSYLFISIYFMISYFFHAMSLWWRHHPILITWSDCPIGQEEIDTAAQILFERMKALGDQVPELIILPVYSALPSEMQTKIFEPAPPGSRKVLIFLNFLCMSLFMLRFSTFSWIMIKWKHLLAIFLFLTSKIRIRK